MLQQRLDVDALVMMLIIPQRCEPLYCPACGVEIGPEHKDCDWDHETHRFPADPFCEVSGARARECGCVFCTRKPA